MEPLHLLFFIKKVIVIITSSSILENNKFYIRAYRDKLNINMISTIIIRIDRAIILHSKELIVIGEKYFLLNVEGRLLEVNKLHSRSSPGKQ